MKHIDIDRAFKTRLIEQIRQRKLKNLTSSLMAMLHINPHGKELVCVCGEGTERDNTEAIYHWVELETCCASCTKALSFKQLQRSFVRFLIDTTGQYPEGI
ncbi:hypothetical protein [Rheinheimera texasensis]|jgi:hypothetical protein|uniref:hypothetical protein n=1 Tax=Rheinheimera texasensis TaxID=306205 RepID=UPI0004E15B8F|nr:hypothetical protein [Rheinheimera texasensis]